MKRLTDEECWEFRKLPMTFNDMIRNVYEWGYNKAMDDALKEAEEAMREKEEKDG